MRWVCIAVGLAWGVGAAGADDWPLFKGNAARHGYTTQSLPADLSLRWVVKERHAPMPAWPVSTRLGFDRACQPVIAGDTLYYGSSADGRVHALDAANGASRWSFFTDGPVRFAPALWKDRLFVAGDDGWLYCLAAADGRVVWKKRGGPDGRMLLGNDRMISRWPARGGPAVHEDIVYFAAGIWPSEGIYIYALEAATGKVIWCNDDSGSIFMGQPHGGAFAASGVAAQGYLVVNGNQLLVPTGRAVPAVFDRATGKFRYFHLQANTHKGGSSTLALGPFFYNAGITYDAATGKPLDPVGAGEVAALPDGLVLSAGKPIKGTGVGSVTAYKWADKQKPDKSKLELVRYKGLEKQWSVPDVPGGAAIIVADKFVVSGGEKRVTMVDREAQKVVWSAEVDGQAYGLAVAQGRLFVSTDRGTIYCFDGAKKTEDRKTEETGKKTEDKGQKTDSIYGALAAEIIRESGVTEGYCLDLGCGDGALAQELAKRSRLQIYAIDSDAEKVVLARKRLVAAGLYGVRVMVHQGDPVRTPYPNYFADLVVSGRSVAEGAAWVPKGEMSRLQRPYGGTVAIGKAKTLHKVVRGPLAGAGQWTHQYADPANTSCSNDDVVKGPLGMLWFRDSDLESPSRHGRGPAPLFHDGRLFVEGMNALRAVNAYNGRRLWEYQLPSVLKSYQGEHLMGTAGTHSNYCVSKDGVYVRIGTRCLRLDPATGQKLAEFTAPPLPQEKGKGLLPWGYLACIATLSPEGNSGGGLLVGSLADPSHVVKQSYGKPTQSDMSRLLTESKALFALDALTGKQQWLYAARHSIRHNAIAIGNNRAFLIDRPLAVKDLLQGADKTREHPAGELVALDATTGKEVWRSSQNVYGTLLALSTEHDVLVMSYQPTRFKLPSEIGGRLAAFRASTGQRLWDIEAKYTTRPLINDRTIFVQEGAWDLLSGDPRTFHIKRSYGCGQLSGGKHLMMFRSATLAYADLLRPDGVIDYGGLRPGCWINAIPAGGLVLVPDATSGCQCSYLNQAWIVLQPMEQK